MAEQPDAAELRCTCCGRAFQVHDLAWCSSCGGPFHLALRTDVPVQDCGDAWIDEELEAVQFGCNRCLQALKPG